MLNDASGNILDDEVLINALGNSALESTKIDEKLQI